MPKRTQKQREAARRNGAKSRGPATPEGKSRSAANAISHGLHSRVIVLANERQDQFDRLLDSYIAHWTPANQPELDLVHDIVAARWRLARIQTYEATAMNLEMDRMRDTVDQEIIGLDEPARATLAYSSMADNGRTLAMLARQESRLRRALKQATEELRLMQAERRAIESEKCQNEPGEQLTINETNGIDLPREPHSHPVENVGRADEPDPALRC